MRRTEITSRELDKKVKFLKKKLLKGKVIAFSMFVLLILLIIFCYILEFSGAPLGEPSSPFAVAISLTVAICVYPSLYVLIRIKHILKMFKTVKELEDNGTLREMAFDLETSKMVEFGDKAFLTDKYLFPKNFKKLPIPCEEIYWFYLSKYRGYCSIKLGTKNNGVVYYSGVEMQDRKYDEILEDALEELEKRAKREMLLDNTIENEKKYKELIKQA